ncbi:MAG: carboxypeptidase-like regulatory domain-containing protein [Candidatus Andersenbacteria bacterium]
MNAVCHLLSPTTILPEIPAVALGWLFTYVLNPLALFVAAVNLAVAVPLASLGRLFQQIFTQPGLLLLRRRRKGYGQVFESLSKRPIDLALVRIIDADRQRIVATRVTDAEGRFLALLPAGRYRFFVSKPGFEFPTRLLAGEKFDTTVGPIYTGGVVAHAAKGPLEANLPIDGPEDRVTLKQALRRESRRTLHSVLAYTGIIVGAICTVFAWNWQSWALLAGHLLLFVLFERLTYKPYGRPWGNVSDTLTNEPLPHSVVRILDTKFNRVLETAVTDRRGQYSFIVGSNTFRLFADRSSYQPYRGNPFVIRQRFGTVTRPIGMQPGQAADGQHNPAALY